MCDKERKKGRMKKRKTETKGKLVLVMKSQLGHRIWGSEKNHEVEQNLQDFQRDGLFLLMRSLLNSVRVG